MKYKNYIKLAALLPLLALLGCEANETPGAENQETVPVTIRLGLEKDGLSTRADDVHHTDALDEDDEIKTLDIYIVDSNNNIERTLSWKEEESSPATEISFNTTLTTGSKHVYAIANLNDVYDEDDIQSIIQNPDIEMPTEVITSIDNDQTIPMSAHDTWTVTKTQSVYSIELVRMVARMNVTIVDERKSTPETKAGGSPSLRIENFLPHTTRLLRIAPKQVSVPTEAKFHPWNWSDFELTNNITLEDGNTATGATHGNFYLHETTPSSGTFTIKFTDEEGKERTGYFNSDLYRNHHFPLVIHITDYSIVFKVTTSLAAIGQIPVSKTQSGYSIELPEGCTFTVEATAKKNTGEEWASDASWTWDANNTDFLNLKESFPTGGAINSESPITFSGKVSAIPTDETCQITVQLKDGDVNMTFNIEINVRALQDNETKALSTSPEQPLIIEL